MNIEFRKQHYHSVPHLYKMLQILNNLFNQSFSLLILPVLFFGVTITMVDVICNFATFRLYSVIGMPAYLCFPLVGSAMASIAKDTYPTSYSIYKCSRDVIRNTKAKAPGDGNFLRLMSSCKPLGVHTVFFIIKQKTILTFYGIAIDKTIFLLLW